MTKLDDGQIEGGGCAVRSPRLACPICEKNNSDHAAARKPGCRECRSRERCGKPIDIFSTCDVMVASVRPFRKSRFEAHKLETPMKSKALGLAGIAVVMSAIPAVY